MTPLLGLLAYVCVVVLILAFFAACKQEQR
jgi:hypothetical protein